MAISPGAHDAAGSKKLRPKPLARRLAKFSLGCFLVAIVDVAAQLVITARESSLFRPDCAGRPLFARPLRPSHAVFTARLVRVSHDARVSGKWQGKWAIGLIHERFWGFLWWSPLVLLTNNIYQEGETYFVDGHRADGFLTHLLPIVEAWPCGGTAASIRRSDSTAPAARSTTGERNTPHRLRSGRGWGNQGHVSPAPRGCAGQCERIVWREDRDHRSAGHLRSCWPAPR